MSFDLAAQSATFEQVCEALTLMGLSRVIAAPVLLHACKSLRIAPEALGPEHVQPLGPVLERSLRLYVGEKQVNDALKRVYSIALRDTRPTTRETLRAVAATRESKA